MYLPPLYTYPLVSSLLLPATFLLTYTISVYLGHTELDWPYISDTATRPPESCIFSQLVNIGALFVAITFYIRYKQVSEYCNSYQLPRQLRNLNYASLWVGWGGALGLSILANFQVGVEKVKYLQISNQTSQETEVWWVHNVGLYLCFGLGMIWIWSCVITSFGLHPLTTTRFMLVVRTFLAVVNTSAFLLMLIAAQVARYYYHGADPTKWDPDDGGWSWHVVSTVSEWVMALALDLTLLSLVLEFKKIGLDEPRIIVHVDTVNSFLEISDNDFPGSSDSMLA
eukprot:GFUD01056683.1.p1 GENE.GFUD01056683.1~~GFUD01056683.1.p1  ORF type:complete len:283 (+),score=83.60 GFUD01056683.1:53-901(+)